MSQKATIERVSNGWLITQSLGLGTKTEVYTVLEEALKAIGTIVKNRNDNKPYWIERVVVEYEKRKEPRDE